MPQGRPTTSRSQRLQKYRKPARSRRNTTSTTSTATVDTRLEEDAVPQLSEHQCCGVVDETTFQPRGKRARGTKPQPWLVRKLMVFITLGIMGYAGYVYIGRFCRNTIKQDQNSTAGRATGIVLLVIFCVLYLWMLWAYMKVVLTSPGYARDHIPRTPQPLVESVDTPHSNLDLEHTLSHYQPALEHPTSGEFDPTRTHRYNQPSYSSASSHVPSHLGRPVPADPIAGPSYEDIVLRTSLHDQNMSPERMERGAEGTGAVRMAGFSTVGEEDGGVGQGRLRTPFDPPFTSLLEGEIAQPEAAHVNGRDKHTLEMGKGELPVRRRPSMTPILHPAYRYCHQDRIVRPYRAHHCRSCGTCVLKFDHHCPWIGQCVGARNHKFFLNFCQAGAILTLYILGTLVGFSVPAWASASSNASVDPQIIVVGALAALFGLFTTVLTCSHVILILRGQTTVESMMIHATKERESTTLTQEYGFWGFCAKREAQRQWNEEWGDLDTEGSIWWTGSWKQGWINVMGTNVLGWILPIGRGKGDGLSYPVNPRFDEQGRLRRRADWPAEFR
ncbi:zf-DHHC-domain-containing protein [Macrolepiota fuliginosa MF-IS2]|uniref:Palmitoyltransferase n=1 Tax=Macrolepiota fuliginosa MF-IS2 TaxID=1400762 RepID=A0A9P6C6T9_9AGAR|nr:zf-DHHC-domain-containing protein [Macrolepiota fuliginosa MF-IS2]